MDDFRKSILSYSSSSGFSQCSTDWVLLTNFLTGEGFGKKKKKRGLGLRGIWLSSRQAAGCAWGRPCLTWKKKFTTLYFSTRTMLGYGLRAHDCCSKGIKQKLVFEILRWIFRKRAFKGIHGMNSMWNNKTLSFSIINVSYILLTYLAKLYCSRSLFFFENFEWEPL